MLNILQINLGGGCSAQNLALQTVAERGVDLLLHSEFYKFGKIKEQWYCDQSGRAAIAPITNVAMNEIDGACNIGFVWVTISGISVYSCYWLPNSTSADTKTFLED